MSRRVNRAIKRGLKAGGFYDTRGLYGYIHEKSGLNDWHRGIKKKKEVDPEVEKINFKIVGIIGFICFIIIVISYVFMGIESHNLKLGFDIYNVEVYSLGNNTFVKGVLKNKNNNICSTANLYINVVEGEKSEFISLYLDQLPLIKEEMDFNKQISKLKEFFKNPKYELYKVTCIDEK